MSAAEYIGRNWFAADTFLRGGRTPDTHRKFKKTRQVHRLPNGDIAVRLHNTDIVTYHKDTDGWASIDMGGWNTVTTKSDIAEFSPIRLYSTSKMSKTLRELAEARTRRVWRDAPTGLELLVHEPKAPAAPPKVWKCRTCSGEGQIRSDCDGRTSKWCNDGAEITVYVHRETGDVKPYYELRGGERWNGEWDRLDHDDNEPTMNSWCAHGRNQPHMTYTPGCQHGYIEPHFGWRHCWRCRGEGRADYGSQSIPVLVDPYTPFLVDGQGFVIAQGRQAIKDAIAVSVALDAKRRIHRTLRSIEERRRVA